MSEHDEQVALFSWAQWQTPAVPELALLFAIPNGGHRNKVTAAKMKAEGVKAGVLDVMLPVARGGQWQVTAVNIVWMYSSMLLLSPKPPDPCHRRLVFRRKAK